MSKFRPLATEVDLQGAIDESKTQPVAIFKHSASCSLSAVANEQMQRIVAEVPVFRLIVQEARILSNAIANRFSIRHESPQLIVFDNGTPVFHTSHRGVTASALREVIARGTPTDS
jgi:bacillithiol system protein YtxJ